ncbi:hypothetical protein H0H81_003587 [Sphagnurus paluster]|uniref:Uncharacterized protein n=1 Tax=Sphagnurus paluster TaxID=117069 RepID=A0A9P7FLS9_9AGAR|nr:hypothetical protein H0H81_003587 [Sphagnurus paluster]
MNCLHVWKQKDFFNDDAFKRDVQASTIRMVSLVRHHFKLLQAISRNPSLWNEHRTTMRKTVALSVHTNQAAGSATAHPGPTAPDPKLFIKFGKGGQTVRKKLIAPTQSARVCPVGSVHTADKGDPASSCNSKRPAAVVRSSEAMMEKRTTAVNSATINGDPGFSFSLVASATTQSADPTKSDGLVPTESTNPADPNPTVHPGSPFTASQEKKKEAKEHLA